MSDRDETRKRSTRSRVAQRFDEMTLAALVAVLIVLAAVVVRFGLTNSEERLACGVTDLVNRVLDLQQSCR